VDDWRPCSTPDHVVSTETYPLVDLRRGRRAGTPVARSHNHGATSVARRAMGSPTCLSAYDFATGPEPGLVLAQGAIEDRVGIGVHRLANDVAVG